MSHMLLCIIALCGSVCALGGLLVGFIAAEPEIRSTLAVVLRAVVQVVWKTVIRAADPDMVLDLVQRDGEFAALSAEERAASADPLALEVVSDFKSRLERRFDAQLTAVYLIGSRARGDHRADSDVDVVVFFAGPSAFDRSVKQEVTHLAHQLLLERNLYIQPRICEAETLDRPKGRSEQHLLRAVAECGILI